MRQAIESAHLQNCMEIYAGLVRHAESQAIHKPLSQQACEPAKLPANNHYPLACKVNLRAQSSI